MRSADAVVYFEGREVRPSKILCVGRNYVEHIAELGNEIPEQMVVFNKPPSSISAKLKAFHGEPLHYEAEIALLIGSSGFEAVAPGIDLTRRQLQSQLKASGLPWERAKAFDGAAVFGEFVACDQLPEHCTLELQINGSRAQYGSVAQMLYKPADILQELATYTTLLPGDIVMTGTPSGVGQVQPGDAFSARIERDGQLLAEAGWVAV